MLFLRGDVIPPGAGWLLRCPPTPRILAGPGLSCRPQLDDVGSADLRPLEPEAADRSSSLDASSCPSPVLASAEVWSRWISV